MLDQTPNQNRYITLLSIVCSVFVFVFLFLICSIAKADNLTGTYRGTLYLKEYYTEGFQVPDFKLKATLDVRRGNGRFVTKISQLGIYFTERTGPRSLRISFATPYAYPLWGQFVYCHNERMFELKGINRRRGSLTVVTYESCPGYAFSLYSKRSGEVTRR